MGQGCVLQALMSSIFCGHAVPSYAALMTIERERAAWPPPQTALHSPNAPQFDISQCIGQGCVLHGIVSERWVQVFPLWFGACVMLRERVFAPVPHLLLHSPKLPHVESSQWIGQSCTWHPFVSDRSGHMEPPWSACVTTERVRLCEPSPHEWLHVDQVAQLETAQWIGLGVGAGVGASVSMIPRMYTAGL
jgi:hypothetical protein